MAAVPEEPVDPADELMFLCLGGGNEVGRSCHILQYKGKTVMVSAKMRHLELLRLMPLSSSMLAYILDTRVSLHFLITMTSISVLSMSYS